MPTPITNTTDYLDGFQYKDGGLKFFAHAEGYVNNTVLNGNNVYNYVFNYTDHLGNVRVTYGLNSKNVLKILEENHYYPFGLKHTSYNSETQNYAKTTTSGVELKAVVMSAPLEYKYKYNGKELQDELGLNFYDYGARNYDPAIGRWMNVDPLADERHWLSPYNYVQNNPLSRIDPTGMLDTNYEDENGNMLAQTNDGNNATVVISNKNSEAFKKDFDNTSVMHRDGAKANGEWISEYGEGMVAEQGASVQPWAVNAMGGGQGSLVKVARDIALTAGEEVLKGKTFRVFNKGGSNFSPKVYEGWKGGSAGKIKTYGLSGTSKLIGLAGKGIGFYGIGNSIYNTATGKSSVAEGAVDVTFGAIGVFGGWPGAFISASYELGKIAGPSTWFDKD